MASSVISEGNSFLLDMVGLEVFLESEEVGRKRRVGELRREKEFEL